MCNKNITHFKANTVARISEHLRTDHVPLCFKSKYKYVMVSCNMTWKLTPEQHSKIY